MILEPLHLSYVIKDEVLKITSEQLRDGEVYTVTYSVADLVIPIPNFVPNGRMGLAGALADAYSIGRRRRAAASAAAPTRPYLASQDGSQANGVINPAVLAQMNQLMPGGALARRRRRRRIAAASAPGGMGGGAQADFDSLIELITTTVEPQHLGRSRRPGLDLAISQQPEPGHQPDAGSARADRRLARTVAPAAGSAGHDRSALHHAQRQLLRADRRRLRLQHRRPRARQRSDRHRRPTSPSAIVGLQHAGRGALRSRTITADFDIPFRQDSFNLATPQFGQPVDVAQFGFAILSDIEAYFLLVNAAQGDRRSNVLQAPR